MKVALIGFRLLHLEPEGPREKLLLWTLSKLDYLAGAGFDPENGEILHAQIRIHPEQRKTAAGRKETEPC